MRQPLDTDDRRMLEELDAFAHEHEADDERLSWVIVFRAWLRNGWALSERQRTWLFGVYETVTGTPVAQNLWSRGLVPRGEKLATEVPAVLRAPLPLKPPGGRA